ncbi:MAG TPA: acetyl-CoA carboxylase biotin carboxylase subunit [Candidatus Dormibacteraeota bacterium]|jgi:acetyl-CoA carboxylase biotin carboxylase subunit
MSPLSTVLIANRGEIALRILRACHQLGLRTVVVYSTADRDAPYVRHADQAVHIGPSAAGKSYLSTEAIVRAAREVGADAVHPGYGFLSERASFAEAVRDAGLTFVGPSPEVIAEMGDKAVARGLAERAGVPTVPGTQGGPLDDAVAAAATVGYPVLVKAAAGGGGRGIRQAEDENELREAFPGASQEAATAFGDPTVYVEKQLLRARHVEVQVLADTHGNVVHCFDRECSLQRRRQKILEEAPSPAVAPECRLELAGAAVRLAREVGYVSAGTVEFLLDEDGKFYFIEMNTRIQVEHPITEAVTGVDLVAEQLRVAAGDSLSWRQEDITLRGAAIECRINAEDPSADFAPSPGQITRLELPGGPGVRVDTALSQGDVVSPYYDSLVMKLVVSGRDRAEALARTRQALQELTIDGVATTADLHRRLINEPELARGDYHTSWLEGYLAR